MASLVVTLLLILSLTLSLLAAAIPAASASDSATDSAAKSPDKSSWQRAVAEGDKRMQTKELLAAEVCFREAVRDVRWNKSNSPDDVALCLQRLAAVLQTEDETSESTPLYKKALHVLQKAHGKKSEELVPTLVHLGDIYENESQYKIAAKYYREALTIVENNGGATTLKCAQLQHLLGVSTYKGGFPSQAEKLYMSALTISLQQSRLPATDFLENLLADYIDLLRKTYPSDRRLLNSGLQSELLKDRLDSFDRNPDESGWNKNVSLRLFNADKSGGESQGKDKSVLTEAPPPIVMDKGIADSVALQQINRQREDFYERMIAVDEKTLGANHPSVARDLTGLAYVYLSDRKFDQAKIVVNRALQIYQGSYGADPLVVKRTELLLKMIERKQPDANDSEAAKDYIGKVPVIPPEAQTIEIALRLNYLGLLLYSEGRVEDAARIYGWALAATARSCGEQSLLAGTCLNDYARVLRSDGRAVEAQVYESAAHSIINRALAKEAALAIP